MHTHPTNHEIRCARRRGARWLQSLPVLLAAVMPGWAGAAMRGDFDGDGRADLLWHNEATGASVIWKGGRYSDPILLPKTPASGWKIAGTGDFDEDARADILWQGESGAMAIWYSGVRPEPVGYDWGADMEHPDWVVAAVMDRYLPLGSPVVWRHRTLGGYAIGVPGANGNPSTLYAWVGGAAPDLGWTIAGTGDFDGDGRGDLIWRHRITGANSLWLGGLDPYPEFVPTPLPAVSLAWQFAGSGDFDRDGRTDILWRHPSLGANAVWYSGNRAVARSLAHAEADWKVATVQDLDGDGASDIVWRHASTGAVRVWPGGDATRRYALTGVTNPDWKIVHQG